MPQISVIVPVYNVEKYLPDCINGILRQTFTDFELILVDDGSSDSSSKLCDEFAQKDSRIKVIHKPNGGAADARNCGIDEAKGEWLIFFDSDDCIEPNIIQKLYETAQKERADMAVCGVVLFDNDNVQHEYIPSHFTVKPGCFSGIDILKEGSVPTIFVTPCNKIYKKELFENLRYIKGRICEDEIIVHHLLGRCERIAVIEDKLYHYRQHENSVSHIKSPKKLDMLYPFFDRFFYYRCIGLGEYTLPVLRDYFWNLDTYYFHIEKNSDTKNKFKECNKNARKLIPYYLMHKEIPLNEKLLKLIFCISPSVYKRITKK